MGNTATDLCRATEKLDSNNICYVYPNGDVLISSKYTPSELANISGIIHQYTLLQKIKRYQQKLAQPKRPQPPECNAQARNRSV